MFTNSLNVTPPSMLFSTRSMPSAQSKNRLKEKSDKGVTSVAVK